MPDDEIERIMARAICVEMQCFDYGHEDDDGDFVTTPAKISLLEARAKDAARAAFRELATAGYVIVPATAALLEKGKQDVKGGRTHD